MQIKAKVFHLVLPVLAAAVLLLGWSGIAGSARAQTEGVRVAVDAGAPGVPIRRDLLGQYIPNLRTEVFSGTGRQAAAAQVATYLRGVFGGFYADYYDWRDPLGLNDPLRPEPEEPQIELVNLVGTLDYLRLAAAHRATVSLNVNTRGVRDVFTNPVVVPDLRWVMTDTATLAGWAADWVHYVNFTVQRFDTAAPPDPDSPIYLERRSAEILADLAWRNRDGSNPRPILPEPGEDLPRVTYWEIGNEPNYPLTGFRLPPAEFAARYAAITTAMIEADLQIHGERTIRVGPSLTATYPPNPLSIRDYVDALEAAGAVVDFVAYHPYTTLFGDWVVDSTGAILSGETPASAADFTLEHIDGIRQILSGLYAFHETLFISTTLAAPAGVELWATEWNPSSWESAYRDVWKARSVAQALGVLETVFSFARLEMRAAVFFADPAFQRDDRQHALYETLAFLERGLGDELLAVYDGADPDGTTHRAYVTRHAGSGSAMPGAIVLWALNWGDEAVRFDFELAGLGAPYRVGQRCELAAESLLHGALGGEGALPVDGPVAVECVYLENSPVSTWDNRLAVSVEAPPNGWVAVVIWPGARPVRAELLTAVPAGV
ncbi:MAG TPA: hypothetical protein VMN57_08475 [Anaerolineales bacterium]|nr:hypothetical protein [Anaerolineales bacterium]